jgi:hypothetical protein
VCVALTHFCLHRVIICSVICICASIAALSIFICCFGLLIIVSCSLFLGYQLIVEALA